MFQGVIDGVCTKNGVNIDTNQQFYSKLLPSIFSDVIDLLCPNYSTQVDCEAKIPDVFSEYLATVNAEELPPREHDGVAYGELKFLERLGEI